MKRFLLTVIVLSATMVYAVTSSKSVCPMPSDVISTPAVQKIPAATKAILNEGFEAEVFPPLGWSISGAAYMWSRTDLCSAYGVGTGCAKADFYNAYLSANIQDLITFVCTPTGANDSLYFDHAYATNAGVKDSLTIWTSTDGGSNWAHLICLYGTPLNTGGSVAEPFVPDPTQWDTKKYALPAGTNMIKFTAYSEWGNNLYLDNVQVKYPQQTYGCHRTGY